MTQQINNTNNHQSLTTDNFFYHMFFLLLLKNIVNSWKVLIVIFFLLLFLFLMLLNVIFVFIIIIFILILFSKDINFDKLTYFIEGYLLAFWRWLTFCLKTLLQLHEQFNLPIQPLLNNFDRILVISYWQISCLVIFNSFRITTSIYIVSLYPLVTCEFIILHIFWRRKRFDLELAVTLIELFCFYIFHFFIMTGGWAIACLKWGVFGFFHCFFFTYIDKISTISIIFNTITIITKKLPIRIIQPLTINGHKWNRRTFYCCQISSLIFRLMQYTASKLYPR